MSGMVSGVIVAWLNVRGEKLAVKK